MKKPNNPPEFPVKGHTFCDGMTLRDYFAGQAMLGVILSIKANYESEGGEFTLFGEDGVSVDHLNIAMDSYATADAMLEMRDGSD